MASSLTDKVWWLAVPVLLFFLVTGIIWPFLEDEDQPANSAPIAVSWVDSVQVLSWDWRHDRTGNIFAVFGVIKNLSSKDFRQVTMHMRTHDQSDEMIGKYSIVVKDLKAGAEKPFREDIRRSGIEEMGFLGVHSVEP